MSRETVTYDPKVHPHQATMLCQRGAVDREIAEFFGITTEMLFKWVHTYPELVECMKAGKEIADDRVERALYNRAVGYNYDAEKLITVSLGNNGGSTVERHKYVEHVPPDVKAASHWLASRRPKVWKQQIGVKVETDNLDDKAFENLDAEERVKLRDLLAKAVVGTRDEDDASKS